MNTLQMPIV